MTPLSDSGRVPAKVIVSQVLIVAGLITWFKVYLPRAQRQQASLEASERERKIGNFFRWAVIEDPKREVQLPASDGEQRVHPQRLRRMPALDEIEQTLGVPTANTTDVRGGLHVTWTGTGHDLEASFDKGRLYCLKFEDRRTRHGTMVFESSLNWHPY
jgi:hypothetical protein